MAERDELHQRVEALRAEGRLERAAELLAAAGEHLAASKLYERACSFGRAAEQAQLGGSLQRAMRLVVLSGDEVRSEALVAALLGGDADLARRVAADISARGYPLHAAALYRGLGDHLAAAQDYQRAGAAELAARCFDDGGKPARAARVLEAALRSSLEADGGDPASLRLALGELYHRHDKHEAAVRVLQQIEASAPRRVHALPTLVRSLRALGLTQAIAELRAELARHGVDPDAPPAEQAARSEQGAEAGTKLYGRYTVVSEVATTPHARVVEATDELSGERVAVKVFASRSRGAGRDALQRFVREARALTQLRHPNVVPLRDFVAEGPAMVLSWMAGGSLRELMDRETLSPARSAEIVRAVLSALAEAHRLGVLHRDVKPSNLLFDEGGTARLADFGAAHLSDSEATVTVGEIGTVAYMSPEQRMGRAATVQSDIYSVGVLLYEMLTGELPPQKGERTVRRAHPDLDESHDALLARFVAEHPDGRFEGALVARDAVESTHWPTRIVERERARSAEAIPQDDPSQRSAGQRLTKAHDSGPEREEPLRRHDSWLGRDVLVLPLDDALVKRASAFARAGHTALPSVLRASRDEGAVWVDATHGEPLSRGGALHAADAQRLRAALAALHRAGSAHGAVDAAHVHRIAGQTHWSFPLAAPAGVAADDMAAFERLVAAHAAS